VQQQKFKPLLNPAEKNQIFSENLEKPEKFIFCLPYIICAAARV